MNVYMEGALMAKNFVSHTSASQTVDGKTGKNNKMERGSSVVANRIKQGAMGKQEFVKLLKTSMVFQVKLSLLMHNLIIKVTTLANGCPT